MLLLSNPRSNVDVVVWFGCQKALPRIDYFYRRAFVPELFTRRVERDETLYQHGGWKNYPKTERIKTGYFYSHAFEKIILLAIVFVCGVWCVVCMVCVVCVCGVCGVYGMCGVCGVCGVWWCVWVCGVWVCGWVGLGWLGWVGLGWVGLGGVWLILLSIYHSFFVLYFLYSLHFMNTVPEIRNSETL